VLVTRAAEQAQALAAPLSAAGAVPVLYPTIAVAPPPSWQPLDDALARRAAYGWAVFTSPSAVAFALGRAAELGLAPDALSSLRIAAVGSQTALALRARGLAVEVVPAEDDQRQEGLAAAIAAAMAGDGTAPGPARRVLFPQAIGGRELLRDELAARGCAVDVVPVSQTLERELPGPPPPFDAATFASPSALRAFVRGCGVAPLEAAIVAVIGPTTAAAAAAAGVRVDVVPPAPSMGALVDALVAFARAAGRAGG
jgi:uroporphyrinogen III methyltransferase/synthase